jgi:hypothetical protein
MISITSRKKRKVTYLIVYLHAADHDDNWQLLQVNIFDKLIILTL